MRLATAVLIMTIGLGAAGLASAAGKDQEDASSPWYARLFGGSAKAEPEPEKSAAKKVDAPPAPSKAERVRRASTALQRRREVCQTLRELADRLDDEDLRRKANQLDQRAWDAYVSVTNSSRVPTRTLTESKSVDAEEKSSKEKR